MAIPFDKLVKAVETEIHEWVCPQCGDVVAQALHPAAFNPTVALRHICGEIMLPFQRAEATQLVADQRNQEGAAAPEIVSTETIAAQAVPETATPAQSEQGVTSLETEPPGGVVATTDQTTAPAPPAETPAEAPAEPAPASEGSTSADTQPSEPAPEVQATPAAVAHAEETGVDLTQVEGTGSGGQIIKADVQQAAAEQQPSEPAAEPPAGS